MGYRRRGYYDDFGDDWFGCGMFIIAILLIACSLFGALHWSCGATPVLLGLMYLIPFSRITGMFRVTHCQICGAVFKRVIYKVRIENKKLRVCPNCNRKIESHQSKVKFKAFESQLEETWD